MEPVAAPTPRKLPLASSLRLASGIKRRAVAWRAVSAGGPLIIEADLSRRRQAGTAVSDPKATFSRVMAAEKALAEPIVPLPKPWQPSTCSSLSEPGSDRDFPADFDDRIHRQPEVLGQVGGVALHKREQCLRQSR